MTANVSSTTLNTWHRHCAAAALRQLRREPTDRSVYGVGVAAHHCLEAMASNRKFPMRPALAAAQALMLGERTYKGQREPPYSADDVAEGLAIAIRWAQHVGVPRGRAEVGVAVDKRWRLAKYDADHWYGQTLDMVLIVDGEDEYGQPVRVLRIEDYKTQPRVPAWMVDSLQMRGALVLGAALARREGCQAVEVQLGALRRLRWVPEEPVRIYLDEPLGQDRLDEIRRDLAMAINALHQLDKGDPDAVASPGAGCAGCPYLMACKPAQESAATLGKFRELGDPSIAAQVLTTAGAMVEHWRSELQQYVRHTGPVPLPESNLRLGFHPRSDDTLGADAVPILAGALGWSPAEESLARNARLTLGNVRALLREMHGREGADHAALRQLEDRVTDEKISEVWEARAPHELPVAKSRMVELKSADE